MIFRYVLSDHLCKAIALTIFRLSCGFELPLLLSDKDQELRKLKENLIMVDELTRKFREKKQLDRDIEMLSIKTSKSYE